MTIERNKIENMIRITNNDNQNPTRGTVLLEINEISMSRCHWRLDGKAHRWKQNSKRRKKKGYFFHSYSGATVGQIQRKIQKYWSEESQGYDTVIPLCWNK